ncbi:MAG: hypothetical protein IJ315_02080 [Firmicutes bacterium]|nr:hypothetical protein [Bacillota bacterium]
MTMQDQMYLYFDQQLTTSKDRRQALLADDRGDEANFEQIRTNVYDIFKTILNVADKMPNPHAFFAAKLEEIPQNWKTSYEAALQHQDVVKIQQETIKLETLAQIKAAFAKAGGAQQ